MSTDRGAEYEPTPEEWDLLGDFIGTFAGQPPDVVRPAFAEAWMLRFESGADEEHYDWFDYIALVVPRIPTDAQEQTRAAMMDHARETKHSVRLAAVPATDYISVVCSSCGVLSGPWNPNQAQ